MAVEDAVKSSAQKRLCPLSSSFNLSHCEISQITIADNPANRIRSARAVFSTDVPMTARLSHAVDDDDAQGDGGWMGRAYERMPMI